MSVANPPIIVTSIYNPAFFEASAQDTITQAQANALFLKKTTADTATALETFSAGIATNSLATTTLASNLLIGSSTNTGTIFISTIATNNTNADPAISIGGNSGTKTIKINNGTNSVHCSSIDMLGSAINNVSNATGSVDIGNLQTSGDINIGANAGRLVDGIINIGTGGTVANPINIGSSTSLTSVGGTLGVTAGIITNKLNPLTTSSSLFIGDNSSSGTVAIKGTDGSTGIVAICDGPTTACTINIASNACTTKIYGLQKLDTAATATCDIALTQTTGVLNIGTGSRSITAPGGAINIGTGSAAVVNPINIGGLGSATTITNLKITGTASTAALNPSVATYDLDIGSTQTSGDINIGVSSGRTDGGYINIGSGSGATAIPITIGGSGSVTTMNGTTNISSLAINAVQRSGTAGTLLLGTTSTTNAVDIAGTGFPTTVKGSLTVTQASTFTGGISLPTPINLTYTTFPTYSAGQIGHRFQDHPANFTMTGTALQNMYTFTSLPIGVYILQAQAYIATTNYNVNITYSATSATQDNTQIITVQGVLDGQFNFSNVWTQGTASNIYIVVAANKSIPFQLIYMTYTRIA